MKTSNKQIKGKPLEQWPDDVIRDQAEKIIGIMGRTRPNNPKAYINRILAEAKKRKIDSGGLNA